MKVSKAILARGAIIALIVVITLLIFSNSFADVAKSHQSSSAIVEAIAPSQTVNDGEIELTIRKAAHLVEFAALGMAVAVLVVRIKKEINKSFWGVSLFYVLAVAVTDEHIQSYCDRNSTTSDILLDFCGALIGIVIGWLIIKGYEKIRRKNA